ncbi:MAG TPA: AsmA family protein [Candidatus Acidoferrales bacterium]|nr:AsmA family protein [Candidatus Acidoferrales bacterium]
MANRPISVLNDNDREAVPSAVWPPKAPAQRPYWKGWAKWILLILACLWVADAGISALIEHSRLRAKLTSRLSAAFGRPVEVGRYHFSLWTGPALEAQSLTVGEDPRFGHEYFVRAESLRVSLRWQSLLRGRLEWGTLSLSGPSLNLVRNAEGDWNLDEWLPRPEGVPAPGPAPLVAPASSALRFRRIEVNDGRINFKRGDEKLPFAFVDVEGTMEMDGPGRWRMDIDATPWRAAVVLQQPGTIHVSGDLGGTSSRLLPAALNLTWTEASVSDLLRLARGDDYGVRGTMTLAMAAQTEGPTWTLRGRAELRQLHRWDLAFRPDNPSINLIARMKLYPQASGLEFTQALLEAPHSNAHVSGRISWSDAESSERDAPPFYLQLSDSSVDLRDLLAWVRAFHSGVADDISLHGLAEANAVLSGWPPRLETARIVTDGADLAGSAARTPVHLGPVQFRDDHDRISLLPVVLSFGGSKGPSVGSLRMDASFKAKPSRTSDWRVDGNLTQVRSLITTAASFGWNLSRGWGLAGPFRCDLQWQGAGMPWRMQPVGSVELGGADGQLGGSSLHALFLNHPIEQIKARIDWKPGGRHIALASAEAFGARWKGTFDRQDSDGGWQFALSADRLDGADLDRWLNPRWRESFLDRMLPFLNAAASPSAVPENLRASGRLSLDQLTLAPVVVRRLQGIINIEGRHIELTDASGQFYRGQVAGSLDAELGAIPVYRVNADFSDVDLSAASAASQQLAGFFAGSATGAVSFNTRGATRSGLLASLECQGSVSINDAALRDIDLPASLRNAASRPGMRAFRESSAAFTCGGGRLQFQDFWLRGPEEEIDGSGTIGFNRNLDFRLALTPGSAAPLRLTKASSPSGQQYLLTGPLAAPQITSVVSHPQPRP